MKRFFKAAGLYLPEVIQADVRMPDYQYKEKLTDEHLLYLKELAAFHQERQATIESKTSQIVGQSSVVFTLFALFVPLFYDKFLDFNVYLKVVLVSIFGIAFLFYLFSIIHAARSLVINKYRYATGDPDSIFEKLDKESFLADQVKDLVYSIKKNSYVDDQKGTNLILAHRTFTIANLMFGVMVFCICLILIFERKREGQNENLMLVPLLQQQNFFEKQVLMELEKISKRDSVLEIQNKKDTIE